MKMSLNGLAPENVIEWVRKKWVQDKSSSPKESLGNRFEFLDGYRGSMAFIVAVAHAKEGLNCVFLNGIGDLSQKYSISGFFLLSSFLLTYRLLKDFDKPDSSIILCILKYFIRRFFRIYLVFAIFTWTAIYGPEFFAGYTYGQYEDIANVLLLKYAGFNHLWTIAPEIKFYFLIPIICVTFYSIGNYKFFVLISCLSWTIYDQIFNFFSLTQDDILSGSKHAYFLKNHLAVFMIGSELGMGLYISEKSEKFMDWTKKERTQRWLNYSSLIIAIYGLIFHTETFNKNYDYKSRPAVFWSAALYLALLNNDSKNIISSLFSKSQFLKTCGKFSFGIYLLNPAAIQFVNSFRFIVKLRLGVVLSIVFNYFLGWAFYNLLEKHLIKFANYLCNHLKHLTIFKQTISG